MPRAEISEAAVPAAKSRTKPASARRTASCGNGPGAERGLASQPTSVTTTPICLAPSARRAGSARRWRRHRHDATPSRRNLAQRRRGRPRRGAARRAGWHTTAKLEVPANITPIFLPSRVPELNPVENVWEFLRGNWLSNLVFDTYDEIMTPHATLGATSKPIPKESRQSACESGRISVRAHDSWYKLKTAETCPGLSG